MDSARELFRHAVATLAYRGAKTLRGAPGNFADFRAAAGTRSPGELLAHIGDLLDWALSFAEGKPQWRASKPLPWAQEVDRFFAALRALDACLAADASRGAPLDKMFQGPVADALTHVGQLACAAWPARRLRVRIISRRVLPRAAWGPISPRPSSSSIEPPGAGPASRRSPRSRGGPSAGPRRWDRPPTSPPFRA